MNVRDRDGETPLHYEFLKNEKNLDVLKVLVSNKCDINIKNKSQRYATPLHTLLNNEQKPQENIIEIFDFLIENKASVNSTDVFAGSPLHVLCENFQIDKNIKIEFMLKLIEYKCDVNSKDNGGNTALHVECK